MYFIFLFYTLILIPKQKLERMRIYYEVYNTFIRILRTIRSHEMRKLFGSFGCVAVTVTRHVSFIFFDCHDFSSIFCGFSSRNLIRAPKREKKKNEMTVSSGTFLFTKFYFLVLPLSINTHRQL